MLCSAQKLVIFDLHRKSFQTICPPGKFLKIQLFQDSFVVRPWCSEKRRRRKFCKTYRFSLEKSIFPRFSANNREKIQQQTYLTPWEIFSNHLASIGTPQNIGSLEIFTYFFKKKLKFTKTSIL